MQAVKHFLLAVQFFTRIPVTGRLAEWVGYSPAMLQASAAYFPAVGWLVGGATALLLYVLLLALPPVAVAPASAWVAAVLSTAFGLLLTGAFHEDGLADLADGLGGSLDRDRALEIMKDSRIGTFGAAALGLALLAKVSLLALLAQAQPMLAVLGLWGGHVVSRTMPLLVIAAMRHVEQPGSRSKPLADRITAPALVLGLLQCALTLWLLSWLGPAWAGPVAAWPWWLAGTLLALLGASVVAWRLKVRLQGFTGDGLGATQQVAEVAFLLGLALCLGPAGAGWTSGWILG